MITLIVLLAGLFWIYVFYKGGLFVRSYMFLMYLTKGNTQYKANMKVKEIGWLTASDYAPYAKKFIDDHTNGKQLPVIAEARPKGFKG